MAADLGVVVFGNVDAAELDPRPITVPYKTAAGESGAVEFLTRGAIPYWWLLEFWAAGVEDRAVQAAAALRFLELVVVDDDREAFLALLRDPDRVVDRADVRALLHGLVDYYERVDAGEQPDPAKKPPAKKKSAARRKKDD